MKKTNWPFRVCSMANSIPSLKILPWTISATCWREQTWHRRLWENYAVKYLPRVARLECCSAKSPETLVEVSGSSARTEAIKKFLWKSKHYQAWLPNSPETGISPTCWRCGRASDTMPPLSHDRSNPQSLILRSRDTHKRYQVDSGTWEDIDSSGWAWVHITVYGRVRSEQV